MAYVTPLYGGHGETRRLKAINVELEGREYRYNVDTKTLSKVVYVLHKGEYTKRPTFRKSNCTRALTLAVEKCNELSDL